MTKHHSPPPTKFGPGSVSQAKTAIAITPVRGLYVPPPTRFGAPAPAQAKMTGEVFPARRENAFGGSVGRRPHGVLQRMDSGMVDFKTAQKKDGELVLYNNFILTKTGNCGVDDFIEFLKKSDLFISIIKDLISSKKVLTVYTGQHGTVEDTMSSAGNFSHEFSGEEMGKATLFSKNYPVVMGAMNRGARDIVESTYADGYVFYAWCNSDSLYQSVVNA